MRKKSTRLLSAALAVCMMLSVLPVGAFAAEPGQQNRKMARVRRRMLLCRRSILQSTRKTFRTKILETMWRRFGMQITTTVSAQVRSRPQSRYSVIIFLGSTNKSLKGIEYFTEISELSCVYNDLTEIDLSHNTKLEYLNCHHNKLKELDVSELPLLETFYCDSNKLQSIDVSENKKLKDFSCKENSLGTLNVSQNKELERLVCGHNNLTKLDVSENKNLKSSGVMRIN